MAYLGRGLDKISNVEVLDNITFDGSSSYTLQKNSVNFIPSSANTLLLSIDGIVQAGNFTVSGSTIDFGTAVAGTSTCNFVLHYGVGLITAPSDGTVTTAKLADDAVTAAKINNDIISGTTALTSEPADTDEFLVSDAGTLKRIDYSLIKGGGITMIDNWRLTTSFQTGDANPISSNLERNDTSAPAFGYYGSQMSVSSGIWTFPSTGIYRIDATAQFYYNGDNQYNGVEISATANNSSYTAIGVNYNHIKNVSNPTYSQTVINCMLDITDITNQKVKFRIVNQNSATTVVGESTYDTTYFRFTRLGDT